MTGRYCIEKTSEHQPTKVLVIHPNARYSVTSLYRQVQLL